jgi:hypothetical protein
MQELGAEYGGFEEDEDEDMKALHKEMIRRGNNKLI